MEGFHGDYVHRPDDYDTGYDGYADRKSRRNPHTKKEVVPALIVPTPVASVPAPDSAWKQVEPVTYLAGFLAACLMALVGAFAAGPLGAVFIFAITLLGVVFGSTIISHFTKRASAPSQNQALFRPDPWAVLIPLSGSRMRKAQHRCNAFLKLAAEVPQTPEGATAVVTIQNRLPELVESYSRARRHASPEEVGILARNLLDTVEKIGLFADQARQQLLNPLISDFEANRLFLDGRVGDQELSPIQDPKPVTDEIHRRAVKNENPNDYDEPWSAACNDIPF